MQVILLAPKWLGRMGTLEEKVPNTPYHNVRVSPELSLLLNEWEFHRPGEKMTKELFLYLAHQVFVLVPDLFAKERAQVHAHINKVQADAYEDLNKEVSAAWQRGEIPKMPKIPLLSEIEEQAFLTYQSPKYNN
jgi:hypothetical protein